MNVSRQKVFDPDEILCTANCKNHGCEWRSNDGNIKALESNGKNPTHKNLSGRCDFYANPD